MASEDASYRRSVRNTIVVIVAMILVIIAALVIPPLVNPIHEEFNSSSTVASPYGLSLTLRINGTQLATGEGETLTAWLNSTSSQVANITAATNWPVGPQGLWTKICASGWPLGVGVMAGYFTADNYSQGSLVRVPIPLVSCPTMMGTPGFFLLQPHGSTAIVKVNGALADWNLTSTLGLAGSLLNSQRGGVYTAIAVDEWGDVAIAHFRVNQ
jgi:hypothetical protein